MSESKETVSQIKETLRADMGRVLADLDLLVQAVADRASEKVAAVRGRIDENLKRGLDRLAQIDATLSDKATQRAKDALQVTSEAARRAVEASKAAIDAADLAAQHAADSGIGAAQRAAEATRQTAHQAVAATKDAATRAVHAIQELARTL